MNSPQRSAHTAFVNCLTLILSLMLPWNVTASAADVLTIRADKPGIEVNPIIYGLMTEEINHSYDGGLYAEMIANRNFKEGPTLFTQGPTANHWSLIQPPDTQASITLDDKDPVNSALSVSLRLDVSNASKDRPVGIANEGYWGIPVHPATSYRVSFYAKAAHQDATSLAIDIESNDGSKVIASATVPTLSATWQKYELTLKTRADIQPSKDNRFVIRAIAPGTIWFSLVSCFPPTYANRPNGNRPDLMQLLVDLQPGFLRFPGGNAVQGRDLPNRFNWKETIHPIDQRPGRWSSWRYYSNNGLGLLEFLLWCDDMKAEPIVAVFAGYCVGSRGHIGTTLVKPGPDLEPYVQEAVEEIEYITGDPDLTKWGAERAKDGHPQPFKLRYVEIGNEDGFDGTGSYEQRFAQFQKAIKEKYPQLQVIATAALKTMTPDVLDQHFYKNPATMAAYSHRYDAFDRHGPKIFVGEWATRQGKPITPTLEQALGDAAFMTSLERNSDLLIGACYAPLLANVNPITPTWPAGGNMWATNMIGFDALSSFGSPSYYAQKMFYTHRADLSLPVEMPAGIYAASGFAHDRKQLILKVVNPSAEARSLQIEFKGIPNVNALATGEILTGNPTDQNSVEQPTKILPQPLQITTAAPAFQHEFPAYSASVIRFDIP